jgi:hypothetical protein
MGTSSPSSSVGATPHSGASHLHPKAFSLDSTQLSREGRSIGGAGGAAGSALTVTVGLKGIGPMPGMPDGNPSDKSKNRWMCGRPLFPGVSPCSALDEGGVSDEGSSLSAFAIPVDATLGSGSDSAIVAPTTVVGVADAGSGVAAPAGRI